MAAYDRPLANAVVNIPAGCTFKSWYAVKKNRNGQQSVKNMVTKNALIVTDRESSDCRSMFSA